MAYTISTHNGSKVSRQHNLRNPKVVEKEPHINPNKTHQTWLDIDHKKMYKKLFGDAQNEYNSKVRRDRQVLDYYSQVKKSATQHTVYEMIVQIGTMNNRVPENVSRKILYDFANDWGKRNPNLKLTGVYYHADEEGAPHLHVDYIPVAHGYKRGLSVQAGLVKALGEQGFYKTGRETAQILWEKRENQYLEDLCKKRGLEIEHPKKQKKEKIKHLDTQSYKIEQELQLQIEKNKKLSSELEQLKKDFFSMKNERDTLKKQSLEQVMDRATLKTLKAQYNKQKEELEHLKHVLKENNISFGNTQKSQQKRPHIKGIIPNFDPFDER